MSLQEIRVPLAQRIVREQHTFLQEIGRALRERLISAQKASSRSAATRYAIEQHLI